MMAAALTRAELERVSEVTSQRVNARIERLAAKRAAATVPGLPPWTTSRGPVAS
jgi:hypothetical protein